MKRLLITCLLCLALNLGSNVCGDDDPIKEKLYAAKKNYDKELAEAKSDIRKWFDEQDAAARKDGKKKKIDQLTDQQKEFDDKGILPQEVGMAKLEKFKKARTNMEKVYKVVIKEFIMGKMDDEARGVQKELEEFIKNPIGITKQELVTKQISGRWRDGNQDEFVFQPNGKFIRYNAVGKPTGMGTWEAQPDGTLNTSIDGNSGKLTIQSDGTLAGKLVLKGKTSDWSATRVEK